MGCELSFFFIFKLHVRLQFREIKRTETFGSIGLFLGYGSVQGKYAILPEWAVLVRDNLKKKKNWRQYRAGPYARN